MKVYIQHNNEIEFSYITVNPGDWVVVKPNLVKESKESDPNEWESVIVSPYVLWQLCEYVCKCLDGKGRLTICDAPQSDSSIEKIKERLNVDENINRLKEKYNINIDFIDLRKYMFHNINGVIKSRKELPGDPNKSIRFQLGKNSLFYGYRGEGKYYGADYDTEEVNKHHNGENQEYLVSATPILADVFISVAKMKTHKKTGVTLCLKNLVGINADKNWLPHHTCGDPSSGGDQFPNNTVDKKLEGKLSEMVRSAAFSLPFLSHIFALCRKLGAKIFGDGSNTIRSGNWWGNDTTWRMVLDLNKCLLYGDTSGTLNKNKRKRYYGIIDGLIGMEGIGPMQGDPVKSNVIIGGTDPAVIDAVGARFMGFDWRKIPVIREAFKNDDFPISSTDMNDVILVSEDVKYDGKFTDLEKKDIFLNFKPHFGWQGKIEYES